VLFARKLARGIVRRFNQLGLNPNCVHLMTILFRARSRHAQLKMTVLIKPFDAEGPPHCAVEYLRGPNPSRVLQIRRDLQHPHDLTDLVGVRFHDALSVL